MNLTVSNFEKEKKKMELENFDEKSDRSFHEPSWADLFPVTTTERVHKYRDGQWRQTND